MRPVTRETFYVRQRRGNQWEILVRRDGGRREAPCPRDRYKHLDGQPEHNVWHWIRENLETPEARPLMTGELMGLVDRFVAYYRDVLKRSENTYQEHRRHLTEHVIPYFLSRSPALTDPNAWGSASVRMLDTLREEGLTDGQIYRCNIALKKFYLWLAEERVVSGSGVLLVRSPALKAGQKDTPLKVFLTPADVVKLVEAEPDPSLRLTLLFGYFFSLRPQEVFGLHVGDLRAGEEVFDLECSKAMRGLKLYGGMAVHVTKQRDKKKRLDNPKNNSKGWVACFYKDGAKAVIASLAGKGPGDAMLATAPNDLYKAWRGRYPFKIKDLRRASLYWLGHNTEITQNQLMKHARQKSEEALRLYLRRPEEKLEQWTGLKMVD